MQAAEIVHHVGQRLRLRVPGKKRDAGYFATLCNRLSEIPDVTSAKANPLAASVTVTFSGPLTAIVTRLNEQSIGLHIQSLERIRADTSEARPFRRFVSGRDINPMFMLGSALTAVGVVQTFRGRIAVPSITAFWYALEAFRQSRR